MGIIMRNAEFMQQITSIREFNHHSVQTVNASLN
jgi:hypothetical protein